MTWKPLLAVIATLLVFALLTPPASARPEDGPLTGSGRMVQLPRSGSDWYGAYHLGQRTAYCADLMAHGPSRATAWAEAPPEQALRKQNSTTAGRHGGGPNIASDRELAELAWVLSTTGDNPSPDLGAAVEHFVRLRTIDGDAQVSRERARWDAVTAAHPAASAQFAVLSRDAARYAGPYRVEFNWQVRPSRSAPIGHVIVAVRSHAGVEMPDVALAASGTGNLTVAQAPTSTGAHGAAHVHVSLPPPDETSVRGALEVELRGLPGTRPRVFVPTPADVQRLLAAPDLTRLSASAGVELAPAVFHPTVTTRTRDVIAEVGGAAVDIVAITGGRPLAAFSGGSTLYGPFESMAQLAGAAPAAAPVVGVAEFAGTYDARGSAEVHSTKLIFPAPGYYTWVESLDPRPTVVPPPPPVWPQLPETSVVLEPEIHTVLTADGAARPSADVGAILEDQLQIAGVPPSLEVPGQDPLRVSVTGRIAGPASPGHRGSEAYCESAAWAEAPTLASYTDTTWEGGPLTGLARSAPIEPGCYSAEATVEVHHGDRLVSRTHHPLGIPEQTILLTAPLPSAPVPVPSPTPVATPSPTPVAPPSPTPVATPSPTPSPTPVATPSPTPSPTPVATPSPTPVATPAPSPKPTPAPAPTPSRPRPGPPSTGR